MDPKYFCFLKRVDLADYHKTYSACSSMVYTELEEAKDYDFGWIENMVSTVSLAVPLYED